MATWFSSISLLEAIVFLACVIPYVVKGVKWVISLIGKQKDRKKAIRAEVLEEINQETAIQHRFESGEARMTALEKEEKTIEERLDATERKIDLLMRSDMYAIKREIKNVYDRAMQVGFIDDQELDLLEAQYAIYKEEGGNGWAQEKMRKLRQLPTVAPIDQPDE